MRARGHSKPVLRGGGVADDQEGGVWARGRRRKAGVHIPASLSSKPFGALIVETSSLYLLEVKYKCVDARPWA
jgi:hypothetical protein